MTYHKLEHNKPGSGDAATSVAEEERARKKKPLNDEVTLRGRLRCSTTLAENHRANATIRNDAEQTTDPRAFSDMFDYLKSDASTLDKHEESEVAAFYAGRSIFITGASGFVGKVSGGSVLKSFDGLQAGVKLIFLISNSDKKNTV